MDKFVAHFLLTKIFWVGMVLPVVLVGHWMLRWLEQSNEPSVLVWGLRVLGFLWVCAAYWVARRMSWYMTIEGQKFTTGVKSGIAEVRFHLSFLPLVGSKFEAKPQDQQEENEV